MTAPCRPLWNALLLGMLLPAAGLAQSSAQIKHGGLVQALAWSADGKRLASAGVDGVVRLTEMPSGKELVALNTGTPVTGIALSPDGKLVGVKAGTPDGPLSLWDLATQKKLKQMGFAGYSCHHLAFTPDGQTLVAAGQGEHMVWNHAKGGGFGSKMGKPPDGGAAAAPNGSIVAWGNVKGFVQLFHTEPRKHQHMQIGPVLALAFSADARLLAAANPDKTIRLWQVQGTEIHKFEGLREPARLMHFSANGKVLAAASPGDPVVRLWDVAGGRLRRRLTTNPAETRALALSPDGRTLALGSGSHVAIWNVATRELGDLGAPKPLAEPELKSAWEDLASPDPNKADAAFRRLAAGKQHALDFLKAQIRAVAVPVVDWKRVEQLLKEMDQPVYQVRQRASLELGKYGEVIKPAVEKYVAAKPSLEGERRAKKLLERMDELSLNPDCLRCLEAIELLELLPSRATLEELARDALLSQVRLAAREAVERVAK